MGRKRKSEDVEKAKAIMEAAAKEEGVDPSGPDPWKDYSKMVWDRYITGGPVPKPQPSRQQYQFGGLIGNAGGWHVSSTTPLAHHSIGYPQRPEIDAPKAGLPKSESTEVITGYRMWPLSRSFPDGYRLTSMNSSLNGKVIPHEKLVAKCQASAYSGYGFGGFSMNSWMGYGDPAPPTKRHEAPHDDCLCGIHAYSQNVPLDPSDKPYAAGEVSLWGKVIVHEHGFRAQYAYPKRLYVIDGGSRADKIAEALSWTYGVPCEVWDG